MQISLRLLLTGSFSALFLLGWMLPLVFLFIAPRGSFLQNINLLTTLTGDSIAGALERQLRYAAVLSASAKNWSSSFGSPYKDKFNKRYYISKCIGEIAESSNWILSSWFRRFDDGTFVAARLISPDVLQFSMYRSDGTWNFSLSDTDEAAQKPQTISDVVLAQYVFSNKSVELDAGTALIPPKRTYVNASVWRWAEHSFAAAGTPPPDSLYLSFFFDTGFNEFDNVLLGITSSGFYKEPQYRVNTLNYGSIGSFSSFGLQEMLKELVPKKRDFGRAAASSLQLEAKVFLLDPNGIVVASSINEPLYYITAEDTNVSAVVLSSSRICGINPVNQRAYCFYEIDSYPPLALLKAVGAAAHRASDGTHDISHDAETGEVKDPLSGETFLWSNNNVVHSTLVVLHLFIFMPSDFILGRTWYLFNIALIVSVVIVVIGAVLIFMMLHPIVSVIDDLTSKLAKDPFDSSLIDDFSKAENDNNNSNTNNNSEDFCAATLSNNTIELSELRTSYLDLRFVIERLRSFMPTGHRRTVSAASLKRRKQNQNQKSAGRANDKKIKHNNNISTDTVLVDSASLSLPSSELIKESSVHESSSSSRTAPSSASPINAATSAPVTPEVMTSKQTDIDHQNPRSAVATADDDNNNDIINKNSNTYEEDGTEVNNHSPQQQSNGSLKKKSVRFHIDVRRGDDALQAKKNTEKSKEENQQHQQQQLPQKSEHNDEDELSSVASSDDDNSDRHGLAPALSCSSSSCAYSSPVIKKRTRGARNLSTNINNNTNLKAGKFLVACVRFHHIEESMNLNNTTRGMHNSNSEDTRHLLAENRQTLIDSLDVLVTKILSDVIGPTGAHLIEYRNSFFLVALRLSRKKARSQLARRFVCNLIELSEEMSDLSSEKRKEGINQKSHTNSNNNNSNNISNVTFSNIMTVGLAVGDAEVFEMTKQSTYYQKTLDEELANDKNNHSSSSKLINLMTTKTDQEDQHRGQRQHDSSSSSSSSSTLPLRPLTLLGPVVAECFRADYIIRKHLYFQERESASTSNTHHNSNAIIPEVHRTHHHLAATTTTPTTGSLAHQRVANINNNNNNNKTLGNDDDDDNRAREEFIIDSKEQQRKLRNVKFDDQQQTVINYRPLSNKLHLPFAICHKCDATLDTLEMQCCFVSGRLSISSSSKKSNNDLLSDSGDSDDNNYKNRHGEDIIFGALRCSSSSDDDSLTDAASSLRNRYVRIFSTSSVYTKLEFGATTTDCYSIVDSEAHAVAELAVNPQLESGRIINGANEAVMCSVVNK